MPSRRIYLLSPKQFSPETIAVAFAKTSRSPELFDEIAAALNEEKSAQFHEKWVVGYGHASVAEHAVLHMAFENVSRLAIESIESNRLASYTEKSTRYQKWNPDDFHIPLELEGGPLRAEFVATCRLLFRTYAESLEPLRALVVQRAQRRANESEEALDRRLRSQYVDVGRFLLPSASLANVGVTANARVLENMIRKMLSHGLAEVRELGQTIKEVARNEIPTLVKYAEFVPYLVETAQAFRRAADAANARGDTSAGEWCRLVHYDPDAEQQILAAVLYRFGAATWEEAARHVAARPPAEQAQLADALLQGLGEHDSPLRELEYATYTFELVMDQGAYAEFKRHRMMTQTAQLLTTELGYAVPRLITEAGFQPPYDAAMQAAASLHARLSASDPQVAQYIVPNGFKRRVLAQFNLREAYAFCQLRSAPNAHFSIRRLALRMAEELARVHPALTRFMHLPEGDTWQAVEERHFTAC